MIALLSKGVRVEEGVGGGGEIGTLGARESDGGGRAFKNTYIIIKYGIFDCKFYTIHTIHTCPTVFYPKILTLKPSLNNN